MAKEIEVKVLNIDPEDIEKKLIKVGARLIKKEYQVNTIFMNIDEDIEGVGKGYLRIRESRDLISKKQENIFTFKQNISQDGFRENEETETRVDNKEALIKILSLMNINIKHEGKKERSSYEFENIRFDIDIWDKETYPDPYLEIEVVNAEDIKKAIRLLDIKKENVTTKSLKELRNSLNK